jgi:hypothetical protein
MSQFLRDPSEAVPEVVFLNPPVGRTMDVDFPSWDDLVVARDRLVTEGWDVVQYDHADIGVRGFAGNKAGEDSVWLRWPVYGRVLEPVFKVCSSWEEFVRELEARAEEDMDKSDDIPGRRVGFVTYGRSVVSGQSEVFRLDLALLTAGGEPARASLIAVLLRSKHPGRPGLQQVLNPGSRGR